MRKNKLCIASSLFIVILFNISCGQQEDKTTPLPEFVRKELNGFTVNIERDLFSRYDSIDVWLKFLENHTARLWDAIPYDKIYQVMDYPIWIDENKTIDKTIFYVDNSFPEVTDLNQPKIKCVQINNFEDFIEKSTSNSPGLLLHHIAILYVNNIIPENKSLIEDSFLSAINNGLYNKLPYTDIDGITSLRTPPASYGPEEYFAELTEAWFGLNDYYPYTWEDIKEYDPTGFSTLEEIWGVRLAKTFIPDTIAEFPFLIKDRLWDDPVLLTAKNLIEEDLLILKEIIPDDKFYFINAFPVWISDVDDIAAVMHNSKEWLLQQGQCPEKSGHVDITSLNSFIEWSTANQPYILLHEFSHLFHFHAFGFDNQEIIATYQHAKKAGIYDKVAYKTLEGEIVENVPAYAITNEREYFAELTEAYFGENDFFPFNRDQLLIHDPLGYHMIEKFWLSPLTNN